MPDESSSEKPKFNFHQIEYTQISESHCGPATLQMMLGSLGIAADQAEIAEAGGATPNIELQGMRVDQLALAIHRLFPQLRFWYKDHATIAELVVLINEHHTPVGVEWQGLFDDDEEEDDSDEDDDDYGHYSVAIHADLEKKLLIIADPYKDYISQDRIFTFDEFEQRWYDYNEVTDPKTGKTKLVEDFHMLFVVTPQEETFPETIGLQSYGE